MPMLDITLERVNELVGRKLTLEELEEIVFNFGMELESYKETENGTELKVEITPDRPDMLVSYGFARALRKYIGLDLGLEKIKVNDSDYVIYVDDKVKNVRPYIGAIVVKNVNITEQDLLDLIYAQEKLHETFCRSRVKASIGLYPLDKISFPLKYTAKPPEEIVFKPLEFHYEMNALEILERHPTGQKYAFILEGKDVFPVFMDNNGNVLSLPPIINSEDHGKVVPGDKNILVEVTGTHKPTMDKVLTILTYAFEMIGGEIYGVKVIYPDSEEVYPKVEPTVRELSIGYVKEILGIDVSKEEAIKLLERMGYGAKIDGEKLIVKVPAYRADILHPIDIVDDIARAYTLEKMVPELTPVFTIGSYLEKNYIIDQIRDVLTGFGYQEAFTFALTSTEDQFDKMRLERRDDIVVIGGSKEKKLNMVRDWLLPEILKMLSYNKDKRKPIKLFELSEVVKIDKSFEAGAKNVYHLAAVSMHVDASFTEVRMVLEAILDRLGVKYEVKRGNHNSFIEGRVAEIIVNGEEVGFVGELHPEVLLNWGFNTPVAAFEIDVNKIMGWSSVEVEVSE